MKQLGKILLAPLAFVPAVYLVFLLVFVMMDAVRIINLGYITRDVQQYLRLTNNEFGGYLVVAHIILFLVGFLLSLVFIVHAAVLNANLKESQHKIMWIALLFITNMFANPFYFFFQFWPEKRQISA